ncbi:MAG: hypothetical protein ABJO67_17535 [Pseudoruegeria sp.]
MIRTLMRCIFVVACLCLGGVAALLMGGTQGHLEAVGLPLPDVYGGQVSQGSSLQSGEITGLILWSGAPIADLRWRNGRLRAGGVLADVQITGTGLRIGGSAVLAFDGSSTVLQQAQGEITLSSGLGIERLPPAMTGAFLFNDLTLQMSGGPTPQLMQVLGGGQVQSLRIDGEELPPVDLHFVASAPGAWALRGSLNGPPLNGSITANGPIKAGPSFLDVQLNASDDTLSPQLAQYLNSYLTRSAIGWRLVQNPTLAQP